MNKCIQNISIILCHDLKEIQNKYISKKPVYLQIMAKINSLRVKENETDRFCYKFN